LRRSGCRCIIVVGSYTHPTFNFALIVLLGERSVELQVVGSVAFITKIAFFVVEI
jgi:hypothetical protein